MLLMMVPDDWGVQRKRIQIYSALRFNPDGNKNHRNGNNNRTNRD